MGNNSSRSTSNIDNSVSLTYINQNTAEILNKTTNEAVANALIKHSNSCSVLNEIQQTISLAGTRVAGDLNLSNIRQTAVITVDFSCINASNAEQDMAQSLLSELTVGLQSQLDAKTLNDIETRAENVASSQGVGGGRSSTRTDVDNSFNLTTINNTHTNTQNIIANSVQSNFEVDSIQECISNAAIRQKMDFSGMDVGGNANLSDLSQDASISAVVNCVNESGTVQKVMNDVANKLGIVIDTGTTSDVVNLVTTETKGSAESTGLGTLASYSSCTSMSCLQLLIILAICAGSVGVYKFIPSEGNMQLYGYAGLFFLLIVVLIICSCSYSC